MKDKKVKALQIGSIQHVSRPGEKGRTASFWLVGESRLLYVRTVEKHNNEAFSYRLTKRNLLSTIFDGPPLSREENVLHAFHCYIDRLEVCGWRVDKKRFYKKGHM